MGIRFHCPNGHKLNVKSFLAGKKGVCPDCGVKLRIPDRSEPGLESGIDEASQVAKSQASVATAAAPIARPATVPAPGAPAFAQQQPAMPAAPVTNLQPAVMPFPPRPVVPQGTAVSQPGYAPMPAAPVAAATMPLPYSAPATHMPQPPPPPPMSGMGGVANDPITENPLATWFVRPPSGGQFGPARGEVMRKWLTEGRVTSDSLVWREGWADWLPATDVFPQLGKPATAGLFGVQPLGASTSAKSTAALPAAKKSSSGLGAAVLVFLALICLLLVGVLVVVLSGGISST